MKNNLRALKATLIIAIFLLSILAVFIPSNYFVSASLFSKEQVVTIDYDTSDVEDNFNPTQQYYIDLNLTYSVVAGLPNLVVGVIGPRQDALIDLDVVEMDDWFTATIDTNTVRAEITTGGKPVKPQPSIQVTLDETAPARKPGKVKVIATCREISAFGIVLPKATYEFEIPFVPAYLPIISVEPETNLEQTSPGNLADIKINLENQGNGITFVYMELLDRPKGWLVGLPSKVQLGSALLEQDSKATVTLTVQPPYGFGYHDDTENIRIKFTPAYYAEQTGETTEGRSTIENIGVKSRGFSIVGIEVFLPIIIVIIVAIYLVYYFLTRYTGIRKKS